MVLQDPTNFLGDNSNLNQNVHSRLVSNHSDSDPFNLQTQYQPQQYGGLSNNNSALVAGGPGPGGFVSNDFPGGDDENTGDFML